MKFFTDKNVPYVGTEQGVKQKVLLFVVAGLVLLALIVLSFMYLFNDDGFAAQINQAVASQEQAVQVAELIQEHADGTETSSLSSTVISVGTSNAIQLSNERSARITEFQPIVVSVSDEEQALEAAKLSGTVDEVAHDLLSTSLQTALEDISELQKLTKDQDFKSQLEQIRVDTAGLLAELEDDSSQ